LVDETRWAQYNERQEKLARYRGLTQSTRLKSATPELATLATTLGKTLPESITLEQLLRWPEVDTDWLMNNPTLIGETLDLARDPVDTVVSDIKYEGYVQRYRREIDKMVDYDRMRIPENILYDSIPSLSSEVRQKLGKLRPETLGQALRIPGITPAAVSHLEVAIAAIKRQRPAN